MAEKPSDLVQGTLDMLILKTLALEPMHGFAGQFFAFNKLCRINKRRLSMKSALAAKTGSMAQLCHSRISSHRGSVPRARSCPENKADSVLD